jgi:hypothetical protein
MDNPEKMATRYTRRTPTKQKDNTICVRHPHTKTNKNNANKTTQYVSDTPTRKQTQTMQTRHEFFYKQLEAKMNRTWVYL